MARGPRMLNQTADDGKLDNDGQSVLNVSEDVSYSVSDAKFVYEDEEVGPEDVINVDLSKIESARRATTQVLRSSVNDLKLTKQFTLTKVAQVAKAKETYNEIAERIKEHKINFVELDRFITEAHPTIEIDEVDENGNPIKKVVSFSIWEDPGSLCPCG